MLNIITTNATDSRQVQAALLIQQKSFRRKRPFCLKTGLLLQLLILLQLLLLRIHSLLHCFCINQPELYKNLFYCRLCYMYFFRNFFPNSFLYCFWHWLSSCFFDVDFLAAVFLLAGLDVVFVELLLPAAFLDAIFFTS